MENDKNAQLMADLVLALSEIEKAPKGSENPFFHSKYADLANIMDVVKVALHKHNLGFIQTSSFNFGHAVIETVIVHSSGATLSCGSVAVPLVKSDPQSFGSALTYAKRYSLAAAFGVATADDDAESAMDRDNVLEKAGFQGKVSTSFSDFSPEDMPLGNNRVICKDCGEVMGYREGSNKQGRKYSGYFCPRSTAADKAHHKPVEFKWSDGNLNEGA